jgi:hypothetical protein
MAQGSPPPEACVDMPQGLWIVPRWLGIEIRPALVLVIVEAFGIIARSLWVLGFATVVVVVLYFLFREAFARDERTFELYLRNRHFLGLAEMRGDALVSSRLEVLERVV